jgi:hypothetical protein
MVIVVDERYVAMRYGLLDDGAGHLMKGIIIEKN